MGGRHLSWCLGNSTWKNLTFDSLMPKVFNLKHNDNALTLFRNMICVFNRMDYKTWRMSPWKIWRNMDPFAREECGEARELERDSHLHHVTSFGSAWDCQKFRPFLWNEFQNSLPASPLISTQCLHEPITRVSNIIWQRSLLQTAIQVAFRAHHVFYRRYLGYWNSAC